MEQYIKKSALEVEIERRYIISREKTRSCRESSLNMLTRYWEGKADAYRHVMDFLDIPEFNVECISKDDFIEKACAWLRAQDDLLEMCGMTFTEDFTRRFRNYLEDITA